MEQENNIDTNLFSSVVSEKITEISGELLEAGIDQLVQNEFLKDIPVFGTAFKGYSLLKNISDYFFVKKLLHFLFELRTIEPKKRLEFVDELEKSGFKKAGEKLLFALNRLDDVR